MYSPLSNKISKQIKMWQWYSVLAPGGFAAVAAVLFWSYGAPFQPLFLAAVCIFAITCVAWWHWSLATMMTMLNIIKETDDHFERMTSELALIRREMIKLNSK